MKLRDRTAFVVALALAACGGSNAAPAQPTPGPTAGGTPDQIVAEAGDRQFTLAELDKRALLADTSQYSGLKLLHALYEARRDTLEVLISDYLIETEARARSVTSTELVAQEVTAKIAPVTEADVEAWYKGNPNRVGQSTLDQVRVPIRQLLERERQQAAFNTYVNALKARTPVRVLLEPPRQEVQVAADDPAAGPEDAAVHIVEFSDFQ